MEADAGALLLRQRALAKLRSKLTGPQSKPKALRKSWMHATDLEPRDVLIYRGATRVTVWRVARIEVDWDSRVPLLQQAEWDAANPPEPTALDELTLLPNLRLKSQPVTSWFVSKLRKQDPDWSDVGFERVGASAPRAGDDSVRGFGMSTWELMDRALAEGAPHIGR